MSLLISDDVTKLYLKEKINNLNGIVMLIINLDKLNAFSKKHADARKSISTWVSVTEEALWKKKQDVLDDFPNAHMIKNNRARFKISFNAYRLVVFINYDAETVVVRFIGTHAEYDRINPETI